MSTFESGPSSAGVHVSPRVPGDKSVSHRCLLLAALAEGKSTLKGLSGGDDVVRTVLAISRFGAAVSRQGDTVFVDGGRELLHEPSGVVDVGNSGTGIRLLAGWSAGVRGLTVLTGDESVSSRPMERVADPLRLMGAVVDGREGGRLPPLVIKGGGLRGIDYTIPVPSAQVKGAILLAGLSADGETTVRETSVTRIHTEELLAVAGADLTVEPGRVSVRRSRLSPFSVSVPADPSQAAFWVVAACLAPGSDVVLHDVYTGPGRAGFLDVLRRMGAAIEILETDPATSTSTIRAVHSPLRATEVGGASVPSLIDEIPVLAVAAAYAEGTTTFTGASELRVKETDRIATMVAALRSVGVEADPLDDGLVVHGRGGEPLKGGTVDSAGDHRVAMALAVAGAGSAEPVTIRGWEAVATSYPGFEEEYQRCAS